MKKLIVALALFLASFLAAAQPADTVRVVQDADSDKICSAVVVAPGVALTARHCLSTGMAVDGLAADHVRAPASAYVDIAVVIVPGLKCPCAVIGGRPIHGATVVAIGYPTALEGARRTTEPARVNYVGTIATIAPWMSHPIAANAVFIVTDKPIIQSGDSGGGLFTIQNGQWVLVGINAVGVPVSAAQRDKEQASGFTPVDLGSKFLPKE